MKLTLTNPTAIRSRTSVGFVSAVDRETLGYWAESPIANSPTRHNKANFAVIVLDISNLKLGEIYVHFRASLGQVNFQNCTYVD